MADAGIYKFTAQVQLKILALLWRDEKSYSTYKEVIKPKYFSKSIHIDICRIIFDYYDKYKTSPTKDVLVEEVTNICEKTKSKQKLLEDYLQTVNSMAELELYDAEYLTDKIISFGKRQALVDAILESADILEKEPAAQYSKIEKLTKNALMVGEGINDLGIDLYDGIEERFIGYLNSEDVIERVPTDMEVLDHCLNGGLGRTEMGVVVAAPGLGKTTTLVSIGGAAVENGYNVLHISLENNEKQILRNYDMRLLRRNIDYIKDNVDKSISAMLNIRKYRKGNLKIKKYPAKTITVNTIRAYLDQLKAVEGFVPDVLIIDYGMLIKSMQNYSDKRNSIESAYEEIRALADDYNCAVWTAAQGNRSALSKKIVTMADLAECFAIANTADVMICLCQTKKEKLSGIMRLFLAKIRDNADSLILKGKIMYETKKLEFTEIVDQSDEDSEEEDEDWE